MSLLDVLAEVILPDRWFILRTCGASDWHIGARRRGGRGCRFAVVEANIVFAFGPSLVDLEVRLCTLAFLKIELADGRRTEAKSAWLVGFLHFWIVENVRSHMSENLLTLRRVQCDGWITIAALDHICKTEVTDIPFILAEKHCFT